MTLHQTLNSHLGHCYPWLKHDAHNCSMLPTFNVWTSSISSTELIQIFILHKMLFIAHCYPRLFCIASYYPLLPTIPDAVRSNTIKSRHVKVTLIELN